MIGNPVVIGGIPLPSDAPLFLAFIGLHVAAGLVCVIAGVIAMLSRKQDGHHPQAGMIYYRALAVVFMTMTVLSISRLGGRLSPVRVGRLVVRCRDDWTNGEEKALARLGANSYVAACRNMPGVCGVLTSS